MSVRKHKGVDINQCEGLATDIPSRNLCSTDL